MSSDQVIFEMWSKGSRRFTSRGLTRRLSIGPENIHFHGPMNTRRRGVDILHDPVWNKDLAFEGHERDRLGLRGLLPVSIQSIEAQVQRVLRELDQESDDIHKNLFLSDLQNRNETLFNRVLVDNVRICKNGKGGRWLCSINFSSSSGGKDCAVGVYSNCRSSLPRVRVSV